MQENSPQFPQRQDESTQNVGNSSPVYKIDKALFAQIIQQHPEAIKLVESLATKDQEFQHAQESLLNQVQVESTRLQDTTMQLVGGAQARSLDAAANKTNAEAEKIREADKALTSSEVLLNQERATTMRTDRTKHTTVFIARMVILAAFLVGGMWSFFTQQPYQLTLGFGALALAPLIDVPGFVKQLKGKSTDKD
jgi:hypothetical protein